MTEQENQNLAYFLTFCVEMYKNAHVLPGEEAWAILSDSGALDWLEENYEAIHTQNHHWILEETEDFIAKHSNSTL